VRCKVIANIKRVLFWKGILGPHIRGYEDLLVSVSKVAE
jgi:hypothetical protein